MTERRPLTINYLLEDTSLFGGVKVVLHHAELLRRAGHRVTVLSPKPRPSWYPIGDGFKTVPALSPETLPPADLHVATFWTTIAPAAAAPTGRAVHFCQGFEAALEHNRDDHPKILEAYALRLPTWTVSDHLAELVRDRFDRPVTVVPPALEPYWRPRERTLPGQPPRVLVPHPFEFYMKGVDSALAAVRLVRRRGLELRLVRLSQWPLGDDERAIVEPDEFHHHLEPRRVASLMAGCDLLLAPSWSSEGFGLAVLEAMASGVPVVASRIPSHESFAAGAVEMVPVGDPEAIAGAAWRVLTDPDRWRARRRAGIARARGFSESAVSSVLDDAVRWAASHDGARTG